MAHFVLLKFVLFATIFWAVSANDEGCPDENDETEVYFKHEDCDGFFHCNPDWKGKQPCPTGAGWEFVICKDGFDTGSCRNYYKCEYGRKVEYSCGPSGEFDLKKKVCVLAGTAEC